MLLRVANRRLPMILSQRGAAAGYAPPAPHVAKLPEGHLQYSRNWSRDRKMVYDYMPPLRGDLPETFLFRKLGHAYELYPLLFLVTVAWTSALAFVIYVSIIKIELRWDHKKHSIPNFDWERVKDDYWKWHTIAYDPEGLTHRRLPVLETIENEMLEAAQKRHKNEDPVEDQPYEDGCHN